MADAAKRSLSPAAVASNSSAALDGVKRARLEQDATALAPVISNSSITVAAPVASDVVPSLTPDEQNAKTTLATPASTKPPPRKPQPKADKFKRKQKPVKAGGAEETGYFDVMHYLGTSRVAELRALEAEQGDGKRAAELEWGVGAEGKDVQVRIIGMSAHGKGLLFFLARCVLASHVLL